MFNDEELLDHIKTKNTLQIESLVTAEWNLNDLENISNYGNYRYRPGNAASSIYVNLINSYDSNDTANYYLDALESKTVSEYAVDDNDASLLFTTNEVDRELYFSLKECFQPFRPRSGINKALWFNNKYVDNIRSGRRPRYYMASRYDKFKYWNSYRKESVTSNNNTNTFEFGISSAVDSTVVRDSGGDIVFPGIGHKIDDVAPFVTYETALPSNRIVVKMQTNLAEDPIANIRTPDGQTIVDPLGDITKSSIPKRWKIQYLDENNNWVEAISFDENSLRRDNTNIVSWDGYTEIYYGIKVPDEYKDSFNFVEYLSASTQLSFGLTNGESYIVGATTSSPGTLYIWNYDSGEWDVSIPEYGFSLLEDDDTKRIGMVKDLSDPLFYTINNQRVYRDVVYLKGLRLVVETMYGPNTTFDLIELSPRLKADISSYVLSFETNKTISKSDYGLPVGGLVASNGQVDLLNYDGAFN